MIKLLDLKPSAYEYYTQNVKGNENISYEYAQKKLTRNVLLAAKKKSLTNVFQLKQEYIYGHMKIVVRLGMIVEIENRTDDAIPGWKLNKNEYIRLSRELGIKDNKFNKPVHKKKNKVS